MSSSSQGPSPLLHVVQGFPPESCGGVETYVDLVARAQAERGRRVSVLAASPEGRREDLVSGDVAVRFVPAADPQRENTEPAAVAAELDLAEHIAWSGAQRLHVHHWSGLGQRLVREGQRLGLRSWVTLHDLFSTCPFFFRLREDLCRPALPVSDCAACAHERTGVPVDLATAALGTRRTEFAEELIAAERVFVNSRSQAEYLGKVPELEQVAWTELPLPAPRLSLASAGKALADARSPFDGRRPLRLISWGGLVRGKGVHLIVEAAELLPPGALELLHLGPLIESSYADDLKSRAHACGMRLEYRGRYEPAQLIAEAPTHDLAVLPSLFLETYGYTTDEAMNLGLPVLVPDRGAPRERIGTRGRTFPVGDSGALAEILRGYLEDPGSLGALRRGVPGRQLSLGEHLDALDSYE